MENWIQKLPTNTAGRSFAVSDIHGCYKVLKKRLAAVGFDESCDFCLPVGDLINRGPENEWIQDFLGQPWFLPVIGNHEAFVLRLYNEGGPAKHVLKDALDHKKSGFDWWAKTSPAFRKSLISELSKLPIATEVQTSIGRVGLIHADVPTGMHWDDIANLINHRDNEQRRRLLSNRERIQNNDCTPVPGIERVYVGHSTVKKPRILGNIVAIDSGAYLGTSKKWEGTGQLSVVRIDVSMTDLQRHIDKSLDGKGLLIP